MGITAGGGADKTRPRPARRRRCRRGTTRNCHDWDGRGSGRQSHDCAPGSACAGAARGSPAACGVLLRAGHGRHTAGGREIGLSPVDGGCSPVKRRLAGRGAGATVSGRVCRTETAVSHFRDALLLNPSAGGEAFAPAAAIHAPERHSVRRTPVVARMTHLPRVTTRRIRTCPASSTRISRHEPDPRRPTAVIHSIGSEESSQTGITTCRSSSSGHPSPGRGELPPIGVLPGSHRPYGCIERRIGGVLPRSSLSRRSQHMRQAPTNCVRLRGSGGLHPLTAVRAITRGVCRRRPPLP